MGVEDTIRLRHDFAQRQHETLKRAWGDTLPCLLEHSKRLYDQGLINEDQFERLRENALLAATSGIRASESEPVVPRPAWPLAPHADASASSAGYMQTLQQSLARQRRLMEATTRQVAHQVADAVRDERPHSATARNPLSDSLTNVAVERFQLCMRNASTTFQKHLERLKQHLPSSGNRTGGVR